MFIQTHPSAYLCRCIAAQGPKMHKTCRSISRRKSVRRRTAQCTLSPPILCRTTAGRFSAVSPKSRSSLYSQTAQRADVSKRAFAWSVGAQKRTRPRFEGPDGFDVRRLSASCVLACTLNLPPPPPHPPLPHPTARGRPPSGSQQRQPAGGPPRAWQQPHARCSSSAT
jgi:hypothetical protein